MYGKVTVIKSLVVPKVIYVSSLMSIPKEIIAELNRLLLKFLWNGTDKVTRLYTINEYDRGGLKMIDLDCMIKSLRLAWLKRTFSAQGGTCRNYLQHILVRCGGLFFFSIVIMILMTTHLVRNFILNFYNGGQSFVIILLQQKIGLI